jgi:hypothetical protein
MKTKKWDNTLNFFKTLSLRVYQPIKNNGKKRKGLTGKREVSAFAVA